MNRKASALILVIAAFALTVPALLFAADGQAKASPMTKLHQAGPAQPKANFAMLSGTLVSIDNADPANVILTVKNDADGSTRTVSVTPITNITKVTDVSELKANEPIRIMTRKIDNKDVALGIMFGKMKVMPAPAAETSKK